MRSALTALGIIIGVGAVICTVAIGDGASARVEQAITSIGANMIWIEAGGVNRGGVRTGSHGTKSLSLEDVRAIQERIPLVTNVSPNVDGACSSCTATRTGTRRCAASRRRTSPSRAGPSCAAARITDADILRSANVCLLGQTVVDQLFGTENPIGQEIRIQQQPCTVVGVLDVKGQSAMGQDQDDTVLMPYTTVMKKIKGQTWLDDIMCTATSAAVVDRAEQDITALLRETHHIRQGADDDFNLRHPTEIADAVKQSTQTMELLLAAVASVSLLVGGIGIMNIMLVSVTERTREIGVRMAIGAKGRDVRAQFLVEALMLSLIGGALGTLAGIAASRTISNLFAWPTRVSPEARPARLRLLRRDRHLLRLLSGVQSRPSRPYRRSEIRMTIIVGRRIRRASCSSPPSPSTRKRRRLPRAPPRRRPRRRSGAGSTSRRSASTRAIASRATART